MNLNYKTMCKSAMEFTENLFRVYLEERDFLAVASMFHKDISWFGTSCHEICRGFEDAAFLMETQRNSSEGCFRIMEQWYEAVPMNDEYCLVFGELKITKDGLNVPFSDVDFVDLKFSMVCCMVEDEINLYYAHFSLPHVAQKENGFAHESLIPNYKVLLEKKLEERTQMLKNKTVELETLANNIFGGIQIRSDNEDLTIQYVSEGFLVLTGYSREEVAEQFQDKHRSFLFEEEFASVQEQIHEQLGASNNFSVEYRIQRKDGKIIWVIDKGTAIRFADGSVKIQCILTDITEQKAVEESLRISEKRYEVAMGFSDITMFEYNLETKELLLFQKDANRYGVEAVIPNGVETFIKTGIIEPEYADTYREMYRKIHNGEKSAQCYVHSKEASGVIHEYELNLTNVFDDRGNPIRAIGTRKNVTQLRQLQKEKDFGSLVASDQVLIYEVNVTRDKVISCNEEWAKENDVVGITEFSVMKELVAAKSIAPEDVPALRDKFSNETVIAALESGQRLISLEYRKLMPNKKYHWFRKNVNIIKDNFTDEVSIRCYIADIEADKQKERRETEEKKHYESMVSKSIAVYRLNVTRDQIISDYERREESLPIKKMMSYSQFVLEVYEKMVHSGDRAAFIQMFSREHLLVANASGKRRLTCEYRRIYGDKLVWVCTTVDLIEEAQNGEVEAFIYVEDINKSKLKELENIYKAEHDLLTGLYNKTVVEKYITDFLSVEDGKFGKHAFFMIDIDYFKSINDNFGHAFGDTVLSQVATKLNDLFRGMDILGRVGGDEFCVLMKNIQNNKIALIKAQEICDRIVDSFPKNNVDYRISASIGIAFFDEHGKGYEDLYKHSDTALYSSKENGRNRFTVYDEGMVAMDCCTKKMITQPD